MGPLKSPHIPFFLERLTARTSQVVMESFRYTGSVFVEMLEGMQTTKGGVTASPMMGQRGVKSHRAGPGGCR